MAPPPQPLPTSMVAHQLQKSDPVEKSLTLNQTAPVPTLKPNQTLVKVLTAALNPIDYKLVEIPVVSRFAVGFPHTPGIDYAGRVWATNLPASSGIKAGDLVFGKHDGPVKSGTLGAFTVLSGEEGVVPFPEGGEVEVDDLAAIGVAGLTAYESLVPGLCPGGELEEAKGKSVFINGGSGGVGTFGIQIAKRGLGLKDVVTSCSGANAGLCKELGADEVIDYKRVNVPDELKSWVSKRGGQKFDLIVDYAGADPNIYWNSHHYLKEGGRYVQVGASASLNTFVTFSKFFLWPGFLGGGKRKFEFLGVGTKRNELAQIAEWMKEGKVKAVIDSTYDMQDARKAFERVKTGRAQGKVLVRVSEDGRN